MSLRDVLVVDLVERYCPFFFIFPCLSSHCMSSFFIFQFFFLYPLQGYIISFFPKISLGFLCSISFSLLFLLRLTHSFVMICTLFSSQFLSSHRWLWIAFSSFSAPPLFTLPLTFFLPLSLSPASLSTRHVCSSTIYLITFPIRARMARVAVNCLPALPSRCPDTVYTGRPSCLPCPGPSGHTVQGSSRRTPCPIPSPT